MADITKCNGTNCPVRENCYRYTAIDGIHQPYFSVPLEEVGTDCEYFIGDYTCEQ